MKLICNHEPIFVTGQPSIGAAEIRYPLKEAPKTIGATVTLVDNNGVELRTDTVSDWLRWYLDGTTMVLTNVPAPVPEPEPTDEELGAEVRAARDALLAPSDKFALLDAPIDETTRAAVYAYRQALRDVPEQAGFPREILWPETPEVIKAAPDPVDMAFDTLIGGGGDAEA